MENYGKSLYYKEKSVSEARGASTFPWERGAQVRVENILTWVYRDQRADLLVDYGYGMHALEKQASGIPLRGFSADGCVALERIARMGVRVDASSAVGTGGELHPVAETVHMMVLQLEPSVARMVIDNARVGGVPDWRPGARPRLEPVEWVMRKGKRVGRVSQTSDRYLVCDCIWRERMEDINMSRRLYATWYEAVEFLSFVLAQAIREVVVMPPLAKPSPWVEENH